MKKLLTKIKAVLTAFFVILVSFSSKVMWQERANPQPSQPMYWVYIEALPSQEWNFVIAVKVVQRLLVAITFVVWIISFMKIRKIDDKTVKKKKIRNAVIIVSILVILIIALLFSTPLLMEYFS